MATTFTKTGSNVIVSFEDKNYSFPSSATKITPKGTGNLIELKDDEKFIAFDYTTVIGVVGANRNAMITALSALFSFDIIAATEDVELSIDELKATQTDGTHKTQTVDSAGINTEAKIRTTSLTITRPANTTAYDIGDAIGDVGAAMLSWADVSIANGYGVDIIGISATTTDTGLAGKTLRIHLNNAAMTSVPADNVAYTKDLAKWRGSIDITFGATTESTTAQNRDDGIPFGINPAVKSVFPVVVTTQGFTPSANSTTIILHITYFQTN